MSKNYQVFLALFCGYATYCLNRRSFTFAMPSVIAFEGFSKSDLGMVRGSQSLSYTASKFISGILSDKVDAKTLFTFGITLCGTCTILLSLSSSIPVYCSVWFISGIVLGVGWPAASKILRTWFPPSKLGTMWSILSTSQNIAGMCGSIFVSYMCANYNWRLSLQAIGAFSITMALVIYFVVESTPENGSVAVSKKDNVKKSSPKNDVGFLDLLSSPIILVLFLCTACGRCVEDSIGAWVSMFTSSYEVGGILGSIAAGYIADRLVAQADLTKVKGSPRMPVALFCSSSMAIGMLLFAFTLNENSNLVYLNAIGFVIGIGCWGIITLVGIMSVESVHPDFAGSTQAVAGLGGNVGRTISGLPFAYFAQYYNWSGLFVMISVLSTMSSILLFLNRNTTAKIVAKKSKAE